MFSEFVDMLNAMRFGNLDENIVQAFKRLDRRVEYTDGIEPTELLVLVTYISGEYMTYNLTKIFHSQRSRRFEFVPLESTQIRST